MTEATQTDARPAEAPRPVTAFELFFDLVFVFALTRVTTLIVEHPDAEGVARGVLVLALLWWAWGAYAWLTNAVDTNSAASRAVILGAMAAMLIVAIAVPDAGGSNALPFALGYLVVRVLHIVLFAVAGGANRAAILRLAPGNLVASVLLVIGVFVPGPVQIGLWVAAVLVDYGTPLITGVGGFAVHAGHFFERHGLFMIIALGETVVSIGVGVVHGGGEITLSLAGAIVLALAAIGGIWWAYFDWEAELSGQMLSEAVGARRAHLARDMFSYLHLPLVLGLDLVAVGLEGAMSHPTEPLHEIYPIALGTGSALFLFGLGAIRGRRGHHLRWDHLAGGVVCLLLIPLATVLPALVTLLVLVAVLGGIAVADRLREAPREHTANAGGDELEMALTPIAAESEATDR